MNEPATNATPPSATPAIVKEVDLGSCAKCGKDLGVVLVPPDMGELARNVSWLGAAGARFAARMMSGQVNFQEHIAQLGARHRVCPPE